MFKEMAELLQSKERVTFVMSSAAEEGKVTVIVIPKSREVTDATASGLPSTDVPLTVTGTPEELDANLATKLATYNHQIKLADDNINQVKRLLKNAEEAAKKKLEEKANKKSDTGKSITPKPVAAENQANLFNM